MLKLLWRIISVIAIVLIPLIVGLLVGAWFGGNYGASFQFNRVRGYEATGQIGLMCGIFALLLLSAFHWVKKNR